MCNRTKLLILTLHWEQATSCDKSYFQCSGKANQAGVTVPSNILHDSEPPTSGTTPCRGHDET